MKEIKTILNFRKVKQSTIIGIAILIALLINLPRLLEWYDIVDSLGKSFSETTIKDILMRAVYLLVFLLVSSSIQCQLEIFICQSS